MFNDVTHIKLVESLRKFWRIEEIASNLIKSLEDEKCDGYFESMYRRDLGSHFVAKLAFNDKKLEF